MRRHLLYVYSLMLLLTACVSEGSDSTTGNAQLRLSVCTTDVPTRSTPSLSLTAGTLASGSRIGVTVQKTDGSSYSLTQTSTTNIPYQATGTGSTQTWSSSTPITLTLQEARVSAYYPYQYGLDPAAIPVTCTNNSPDWMYATWQTASTDESYISELYPEVALTLKHAQTVVVVTLTSNGYTGPGRVSQIDIDGSYGRSGTLNSYTGEVTGVTKAPITNSYSSPPASFANSGSWTDQWFVLPIASERPQTMIFQLTIDGAVYRTISSSSFERGKIYRFNLTLGPTKLDVTGIDIIDWTTVAMTAGGLVYADPYEESSDKYDEDSGTGGGTGTGIEDAPDGVLMCSDENYDYYWAPYNLYATDINPIGGLYRYGEVNNFSWTDVSYMDVSNTQFDAASHLWGNGWHIPTDAEWKLLMEGCTFELEEGNEQVKATSKTTEQVISFPVIINESNYTYFYTVGNLWHNDETTELQSVGFMCQYWQNKVDVNIWGDVQATDQLPIRAVRKVAK